MSGTSLFETYKLLSLSEVDDDDIGEIAVVDEWGVDVFSSLLSCGDLLVFLL